MDLDPYSATTPARIKILLLPIGHVKRSRFLGFVKRLQHENVVRLGDVSPDGRPHRTMFSPLAFPTGLVLYEISTTLPPLSHLALAPFELYRAPLIVAAVADGDQFGSALPHEHISGRSGETPGDTNWGFPAPEHLDSLLEGLGRLRNDFPGALVHQVLIFDYLTPAVALPDDMIAVPSPEHSKTTTIKTVMCDLTSRLLAEMTTFAKSLQALTSLNSPSAIPCTAAPRENSPSIEMSINGPSASSRPSSASLGARNLWSPGETSNHEHRVSMPAQMPLGTNSRTYIPDVKAISPPNGVRTPPTTFDEIAATPEGRSTSRDRVSVHGFGAGGAVERERNKGKGRIAIVIGSLYLLAGRWPDAMKELVEGAVVAKANSDYLWHGKALDYVLVCLLMYAWAGMDFRIPQMFYPGAEKSASISTKSSSHTPPNSLPDSTSPRSSSSTSRSASLQSLVGLLPDVMNNVLNLYTRAWMFSDEKLPQLAFSDTAIRFSKLLTAIQLSHGNLSDDVLKRVVLSSQVPKIETTLTPTAPSTTKTEIISLLFRAYPTASPELLLPITDRITILAGIASVLSELECHRKKAFVLQELMSVLLPALVQARKDGAANMGVHPAASLPSLGSAVGKAGIQGMGTSHEDLELGVQHFLVLVCEAFRILPVPSSVDHHQVDVEGERDSSSESSYSQRENKIIVRALRQAFSHDHGSRHIKIEILRSCINICEALPDLGGVLRFSVDMLRTAGSSNAPGPESSDGSATLPVEDQICLATKISRTVSIAQQLGLEQVEPEYWDEFLVRGIEMVEALLTKTPIVHTKAELEFVDNAKVKKTPFIYNPSLKNTRSTATKPALVVDEEAVFRVALQNLYDFDIEVESLKLDVSGVSSDCPVQRIIIGPYRTQTTLLSGVPKASGTFTITGCVAKIKGCRKRKFPIFSTPWTIKPDVKTEGEDLTSNAVNGSRPTSTASEQSRNQALLITQGPSTSVVTFDVIGAQPDVVLKSTTLSQSAIMLLEGETKTFNCIFKNVSTTVPVDLLQLSFNDSTASQLRSALTNKDLSTVEMYELELASSQKQAFQWHREGKDSDVKIDPGQERLLEIEVLGKPGLSYGTIQIDYGYVGVPKSDIKNTFYTRKMTIPITVTVNASAELVWNDLIPFTGDFAWQNQQRQQQIIASAETTSDSHRSQYISRTPPKGENRFQALLGRIGLNSLETDHCLLLLDLRNSWPNPLTFSIQVRSSFPPKDVQTPGAQTDPWQRAYTVHEVVQPGHNTRLVLIIPRTYLTNPHAPIPSLNPATKRQYVVSSSKDKASPEAELATREAFWYREELLNHIRGTWTEDSTHRTGFIDLRALRLSTRMVSALKLEDLDIDISISLPSTTTSTLPHSPTTPRISQTSRSTFHVPLSTFLTLSTTITNRSPHSIHPLLRLLPTLAGQPHSIALDLSKKFLVNGLLQRALPVLGPGETCTSEVGVLVLAKGVYEVGGCVEEVRVLGDRGGDGGADGGERGKEEQEEVVRGVLRGSGKRRVWWIERACIVVGRDGDEGEGGV